MDLKLGPVRGFNTLLFNPADCSTTDRRNFDTHAFREASQRLADYLKGLRTGSVVLGVVGDEATNSLTQSAREALRTMAGVPTYSLSYRGKLTFYIVSGSPNASKYKIKATGGNNLVMKMNPTR